MDSIGLFPGRRQIRGWLRAGVMEQGTYAHTIEGTPQGGVISPLLLNVALHGMGGAINANVPARGTRHVPPALVLYADDFVVLCASESEAHDLQTKLAGWLQPRGLSFNEEKTRVVHLAEGFDFLGFNVRRYDQKLIIKPSKDAVQRVKKKVRTIIRQHRGAPAERLAGALGPLVRGWSTYYRHVVSKETFRKLDDFTHHALRRWAIYCNRRKTPRWLRERYWGKFDKSREDRWVFGSKAGYMPKFAWTGIVRHVMVKGDSSQDDAELDSYWRKRARKRMPGVESKRILLLAARQKGLCPRCGQDLIEGAGYDPDDVNDWARCFTASYRGIHVHHLQYRSRGGSDHLDNLEVVHTLCHRQLHAGDRKNGTELSGHRPA